MSIPSCFGPRRLKHSQSVPQPQDREPPQSKQRHQALTAWLGLLIVGRALSILNDIWKSERLRHDYPNAPEWCFYLVIAANIFAIISVIALFRWKQWGFWGFIGSGALVFFASVGIGFSILAGLCVWLVGTGILFAFLHIGGDKKAWIQLE